MDKGDPRAPLPSEGRYYVKDGVALAVSDKAAATAASNRADADSMTTASLIDRIIKQQIKHNVGQTVTIDDGSGPQQGPGEPSGPNGPSTEPMSIQQHQQDQIIHREYSTNAGPDGWKSTQGAPSYGVPPHAPAKGGRGPPYDPWN